MKPEPDVPFDPATTTVLHIEPFSRWTVLGTFDGVPTGICSQEWLDSLLDAYEEDQ